MKIITYYLLLLVTIVLLSGFLLVSDSEPMSMHMMISVCIVLVLYVVGLSLVGEGKTEDERETHHRYIANRAGLVAGTIVLSSGILYELFTHTIDYWLLASLVAINLTKIITLIRAHYNN